MCSSTEGDTRRQTPTTHTRIQLTRPLTHVGGVLDMLDMLEHRGRYQAPGTPQTDEKPLHLNLTAVNSVEGTEAKQKAVDDAATYLESLIRGGGLPPPQQQHQQHPQYPPPQQQRALHALPPPGHHPHYPNAHAPPPGACTVRG